jgi:hypothetical protein
VCGAPAAVAAHDIRFKTRAFPGVTGLVRLVLRTQPRSVLAAIGGGIKMHPWFLLCFRMGLG